MKYIKYFNESIKHLLKPKSDELLRKELEKIRGIDRVDKALNLGLNHLLTEEDILKDIEYLNDWKKLKLACKHNLLWLVKYLLKNDTEYNDIHDVLKLGYSIARRLNNKEVYTFLDKYIQSEKEDRNKMLNESVRHLLKPKSEEQINKSIENFLKLPELDKVTYFLEYNLFELLGKEKAKELINTINPEGRLEVIGELELDDDVFSDEEIKEIVKMGDYLDQISWIYTFDLERLFDQKYIKDIIYKNNINVDQVLDTILIRFSDELDSTFNNNDVKEIISKEDDEEMLRLINKYELEDIYDENEIKDIIIDMKDSYSKLDWMLYFDNFYHDELGGLFSIEEMTKIYNKLTNEEKEKIENQHRITF